MTTLSLAHRERLRPFLSSVLLLPFCAYFVLVDYGTRGLAGSLWFITHSVNLLPHEAGHFFFRFFGTFMMFVGGSIWQLVFPCIFAWYCLSNDLKLGLQISLLWLGQNFIDVSVYAADAQARALPLIGGLGAESHDWYNILQMLGWLEHTPLIAGLLYAMAFPCWLTMVLVPRWVW